ncbi:hypothetical protein EV421DRAFT_1932168 [Armillaria borealis]|uniref:Uncharacterized protein n=1 Tax=Armillaria borealis TaxID=47425 RepID=A0AA39IUK4_9AGAR|nr:hypothetical protein EV421DRAFT_1932168 [Armillaria borealis]
MSFLRPENPPPESLIYILRGNITLPDEDLSQIQDTVFASEQAISHLTALVTGQCSQLLTKEASQLNERHKSLTQHLQLSEEYPLDILISYQDTFEEDDRGILSLILQHSTRWKRMQIKLDVSRTEVDTVMSELSIVAGNLPLLEELTFLSVGQLGNAGAYYTEMLVAAPSLWRAWLLPFNCVRRMAPLNANLTHYSGAVACLEDIQHIMKLPALIECYLRLMVNNCLTRTTPLRNDHIL